MTPNLLSWCRPLCVLVCFAAPAVDAQSLSLCTARTDGNYYAAGQIIQARSDDQQLRLELLETAGSVDNLTKLARGECDAAIVQLDAYLVYQETHRKRRLELARPNYLYEEFVHLICRRDAGVHGIEDLADQSAKHRILIGEPQSGSAATWRSFTLLDPGYRAVATEPVGGMQALAELQKANAASCMIYVSGLRSKFSAAVDAAGDSLQIVSVDDPDLDQARFAGDRIYRFRKIPAGTYPGLEAGGKGRGLETLTVGATLFVSQRWAAQHYDAHRYLVETILQARPAILERVAPR
jgi:hypothetical protein